MNAPVCYVIQAGELTGALASMGWAFTLALLAVWLAGVDWWQFEWRWRNWCRRRRLRAIRARRLSVPS